MARLSFLVAVLLAAQIETSWAQTIPPKVRGQYVRLYTKGNAYLYSGKFLPAIAHFKRAIALAPRVPGAWRQLGLAYESMGRYKEAIEAYEKYLELAGETARYAQKVQVRINFCRKQLGLPPKVFGSVGKVARGRLTIRANVEGALVLVDNVERGTVGQRAQTFDATAGRHTVTVTKLGYLPFSASVEVYPDLETKVEAHLHPNPNYRPPVSKPRGTRARTCLRILSDTPNTRVVLLGHGPLTPSRDGAYEIAPGEFIIRIEAPGHMTYQRRLKLGRGACPILKVHLVSIRRRKTLEHWAWGTLGAAATAAVAGMILGFLEDAAYEKVRDRDVETRAELNQWADRARAYRAASLSLYGLAGVGLAASAILFIMHRHSFSKEISPWAALTPGPRGVMVSGEVSF